MKIIDNRNYPTRRFEELDIGDVFLYSGSCYMKINVLLDDDENEINCISLATGYDAWLNDTVIVEPCKAELILKG